MTFEFDAGYKMASDKLTELLTSTLVIQSPDWKVSFEIIYDVSDYVVSAILGQRIGETSHVIYYTSRTLNDA